MFCVETAGIFVLLLSEFSVAFCLRGGINTKTAVSRKYVSALSTLLTLLLPTDLMKMWLFFWINLMIEFPVGSQRRQQRPESVCLSQSSGLLWGKSFRTSHLCKCIKFLWLQFYVQLNSSNKHHSTPSQLHMAASCTVTSIKHWRPCSTGPYCPWECVLLVMAAREFRYSPLITLSRVRKGLFFPGGMMVIMVCVQTGGMPAPEQSPVTEEGLLLTIRDGSTGRKMEAENTANNILASVKEQVAFSDPQNPSVILLSLHKFCKKNGILILIHTWIYTRIYFSCNKYSKKTPILWSFSPTCAAIRHTLPKPGNRSS